MIVDFFSGFNAGYSEAFAVSSAVATATPFATPCSNKKRRRTTGVFCDDDGRFNFETEFREMQDQLKHVYAFVKRMEAKENTTPVSSYHSGVVKKYFESVNADGKIVSFIPCDSTDSLLALDSLLNFNELMISLVSNFLNQILSYFLKYFVSIF